MGEETHPGIDCKEVVQNRTQSHGATENIQKSKVFYSALMHFLGCQQTPEAPVFSKLGEDLHPQDLRQKSLPFPNHRRAGQPPLPWNATESPPPAQYNHWIGVGAAFTRVTQQDNSLLPRDKAYLIRKALGRDICDPVKHLLYGRDADQKNRPHSRG